jgi:hypothetical protein
LRGSTSARSSLALDDAGDEVGDREVAQALGQRLVGVRQELRRQLRDRVEVAIEDRPRQPRLLHDRAHGERRERPLDEQRTGRLEDPSPGLGGGYPRAGFRS